nr:hypothetical protein [uncultured Holophaga sp.]
MLHQFHCQATTTADRFAVLPGIREAIDRAGAWVTDFRTRPEGTAVFGIEAAAGDIPALHETLGSLQLQLEPDLATLGEYFRHQILNHPEQILAGTLTVKFLGNP